MIIYIWYWSVEAICRVLAGKLPNEKCKVITCLNLISQGFERVFDSFTDIQLDIPNAHTILEKFTDMCARDGIIPISFTLKVPSRYVYHSH